MERFSRILEITQKPFSTGQASNLLTFTGIFDQIRNLFSQTDAVKFAGLKKQDFSLNTKGGRCENCQGHGKIKVNLDFVSNVWIKCVSCQGKRYTEDVLACDFNKKNISEVLEILVTEAAEFFASYKNIYSGLMTLNNVGLGYLYLGQSTNTTSGGELQRLMLARELSAPGKENTLCLFDEPGTGLHPQDIEVLIKLFQDMAGRGYTLLIIEHDADFILQADWVIDLGPGGDDNGGDVVVQGWPEEIANNQGSLTGRYLSGFID